MPAPLKLLLTSAGRRVELLRCFRADAAALGLDFEVHAADLHPHLSAACAEADHSIEVPRCDSPHYADALLDYCCAQGIGLLVPTIDTELLPLARAAGRFREAGVLLNLSSEAAVAIARDKLETARALGALGIAVPHTAPATDFGAGEGWRLPVLFKPAGGSASVGVQGAATLVDATRLAHEVPPGYLVQELQRGPEYTVNCYYDNSGRLRCAVPHQRLEVRAGEVAKGRTQRVDSLLAAAQRMEGLGGLFGALCFQAILTEAGPVVFEINARFGGGYPLAHRAGARFTRWLLQHATGIEPDYSGDWQDGLLMLRYDAAIFQ